MPKKSVYLTLFYYLSISLLFTIPSSNAFSLHLNNTSCGIENGGVNRTRHFDSSISFALKSIRWQTTVNSLNSGPLCSINGVFLNDQFYDQTNGTVVWKLPVLPLGYSYGSDAHVIYKEHLYTPVFFHSNTPSLLFIADIFLNKKTIDLIKTPIHFKDYTAVSLLPYDKILYISASTGDVLSLSLSTHKILWRNKFKTHIDMPLTTDGARLFLADYNGLEALNLKTGHVVWNYKGVFVEIAAENNRVYADGPYEVYAFLAPSGKLLWKFDDSYFSAPLGLTVGDGKVFFFDDNANNKNFYALNAQNGTVAWIINNYVIDETILMNHELYVAEYGSNFIHVIDEATGKELRNLSLKFEPALLMPLTDQLIVAGAKEWKANSKFQETYYLAAVN